MYLILATYTVSRVLKHYVEKLSSFAGILTKIHINTHTICHTVFFWLNEKTGQFIFMYWLQLISSGEFTHNVRPSTLRLRNKDIRFAHWKWDRVKWTSVNTYAFLCSIGFLLWLWCDWVNLKFALNVTHFFASNWDFDKWVTYNIRVSYWIWQPAKIKFSTIGNNWINNHSRNIFKRVEGKRKWIKS